MRSRCKNREEKGNRDPEKLVSLPIYKDSVSTTAHQTRAREWLRQKFSRTKTVNVRRYQNQKANIDEVDHTDRDSPPPYADDLLENENLVKLFG